MTIFNTLQKKIEREKSLIFDAREYLQNAYRYPYNCIGMLFYSNYTNTTKTDS